MEATGLLVDGFDRVDALVRGVLSEASAELIAWRPDPESNSVGWLVWHLLRVQDDHIAEVAGVEQAWIAQGWAGRFALPFDDDAIGYGQSADDVRQVRPSVDLLTGYAEAVHRVTRTYLDGLAADDLDGVVDDRWDPPVTLAVRLVSVLSDDLQHVGQAAYLRGLFARRQ